MFNDLGAYKYTPNVMSVESVTKKKLFLEIRIQSLPLRKLGYTPGTGSRTWEIVNHVCSLIHIKLKEMLTANIYYD